MGTGTRDAVRLDPLQPGDHVGWIVGSAEEYERLSRWCLADGARAGDKLFVLGSRAGGAARATHLPELPEHTRLSPLRSDALDPDAMGQVFARETAAACHEGYRGVRVLADMEWLLDHPPAPTLETLVDFELRLGRMVAEMGAIVVCAYRARRFDPGTVAQVMCVHGLEIGENRPDRGFRMWSNGQNVWEVHGEVDLSNAAAFRAALETALSDGDSPDGPAREPNGDAAATVRLRLSGLRFIDVTGMRTLALAAQSRRPGVRLVVQAAPRKFRRWWELLGYDQDGDCGVEIQA
ncbi:Anti-anti-sigma regulatory factor (antagonist of anti-sigma factor) [Streptoalloteichus hindustanus]|uniref:Anti-anti-sigma regulatory factor (Antagonist of anti-sigma factor) n=1 Tax=Streptoalloteichus hindustanus TaxID=2017 RepID=A0A1M4Y892_STRHI|nr:Anti-anti-sigma regulatory factor (antagonist of anti-sigma factor) [Streptoalloteichus hindustanus]